MPKKILVTSMLLLLAACSTVPLIGRNQFNIIPDSLMLNTSLQQYSAFLGQNEVITGTNAANMVNRTGSRISRAVTEYLVMNGMQEMAREFQWEFNLVKSDDMNAWCMPGGKVVIYSGILKATGDEAGLAVVMGHEIAHAVARHGNERMSQALATQMGGLALAKALSQQPAQTQQLWMGAFGLGAQFGFLLPYSRLHENEAARLGLIFMAMAGYNPLRAVAFWQKMADLKQGQSPPEFASTHPADSTRIKNIMAALPEARRYYRPHLEE